jgi:hypothetical protein
VYSVCWADRRVWIGLLSSVMGFIASCAANEWCISETDPRTYDVHVAKFIQPKVVHRSRCHHEVSVCQVGVDFSRSSVEFVQNPALYKTLLSCRLKANGKGSHSISVQLPPTLAVDSGTKSPSSLSIANFVALKILLQNLR